MRSRTLGYNRGNPEFLPVDDMLKHQKALKSLIEQNEQRRKIQERKWQPDKEVHPRSIPTDGLIVEITEIIKPETTGGNEGISRDVSAEYQDISYEAMVEYQDRIEFSIAGDSLLRVIAEACEIKIPQDEVAYSAIQMRDQPAVRIQPIDESCVEDVSPKLAVTQDIEALPVELEQPSKVLGITQASGGHVDLTYTVNSKGTLDSAQLFSEGINLELTADSARIKLDSLDQAEAATLVIYRSPPVALGVEDVLNLAKNLDFKTVKDIVIAIINIISNFQNRYGGADLETIEDSFNDLDNEKDKLKKRYSARKAYYDNQGEAAERASSIRARELQAYKKDIREAVNKCYKMISNTLKDNDISYVWIKGNDIHIVLMVPERER